MVLERVLGKMDIQKAYQNEVGFLYSLQKFGIKFGLSKTSNLLKAFGNPHVGQKYVHIGGTNGKGSVSTFIASILRESGLKVGFYSSPHLVRFTERFKINGEEIPKEEAARLIRELREVLPSQEPPTFFEVITAMALIYFARENTDVSVIEVGMGGRLDATNVITPLVSVITNISKEHTQYLGSRLLDIAGEKGGIIKKGIDVVTGVTQPEVLRLFESIASEKGAPLWRVGKDIRYRAGDSAMHYSGLKKRFQGLELGLRGKFQARNAALALAAVERLEEKSFTVSEEHIRGGLKKAAWIGRMHVVAKEPTILLDGAHNPGAIRALADSITKLFNYDRMILVIGVMGDKEIGKILGGIVPLSDYVIYTRPVYARAARPEVLMEAGSRLGKHREIAPFLTEALDRARQMATPRDLILVPGSLFTVGEALTYFDPVTYSPDGF